MTTAAQAAPTLQALGRIVSGIYVLTTGAPDAPDASATMVSFVQQFAFEPPLVGVALNKTRAVAKLLTPGKLLALNIVHAGDRIILRRFAAASLAGPQTFADVRTRTLPSGLTVLLDACAYLECRLTRIIDLAADHDLYIAEVLSGDLLASPGAKPTVHIRHDGSHY